MVILNISPIEATEQASKRPSELKSQPKTPASDVKMGNKNS